MAVRDTINKALGYIGVISVSRTFKGNLLLVPNPQGKKQPLSDRQSVWLPALRSLPGLEVAKIPDQEQWFKLVAHGVPVRPFSMGNAFDEDLFKSEVFTFNQIEVIGKPRWLADPTGKGKLAASVAFAVPSQTVANKALEKGLYIAGEKVTVQVLKGYSNRTQCFKCQGFGHDPLSCRKRACRFCGENHYTKDHQCKNCLSNNSCPHLAPRCANCQGAHPADSPNCQIRGALGIGPSEAPKAPQGQKRARVEGITRGTETTWEW